MTRVFFSYVQEDYASISRLAQTLGEFSVEVWLDRESLKPGQRWADEIRRGISQGDFFLAFFSQAYANRDASYMNEELTLAIEELRRRPTDRAWFIPVLLSDKTTVPDRTIGAGETLRSIQWVNLYEDWHRGVEKILAVISPGSDAILKLTKELQSESARARIKACDSLGRIGPIAEQSVPALAKLLRDDNTTVRAAAAEALGEIGIAHEHADSELLISELLTIMKNADVYYASEKAATSLTRFGRQGVAALLQATSFTGYAVASDAYDKLVFMGETAIPHLRDIIESKGPNHQRAMKALADIERRITI